MKKNFYIILGMIFHQHQMWGQINFVDTVVNTPIVTKISNFFNCSYSSNTYINKYKFAETYIPSNTSAVKKKIIKVNYNIFQKSDGTGNFTSNDIQLIYQHFNWVRGIYLSNPSNSDPPSGVIVNDLSDKRIDFEVGGIYFYQNDYLSGNNWGLSYPIIDSFLTYIKNVDSSRLLNLNIFFSEGTLPPPYQNARGYANMPSISDKDMGIVILRSYSNNLTDGTIWTSAQTTAHEIGHVLGLCHTYYGGGCNAICNPSHFDYLYDVFGYPSTCPHVAAWSPSAYASPNDKITNNLMGGNVEMSYLSPKQIGQCHRSLYILTTGKYAKCTYDPNFPWIINSNETWDFGFRSFEDIWVQSPAQLNIQCVVQLTDSSKFIVDNGAIVNVSTQGKIENRCGCNGNIYEIAGQMNVQGNFNIPPNTIINIYSTGILSVDSLCINPGVIINIFNGGKVYIKGMDYTNQLQLYNNQYNALVTMPLVIGNVYAYNQIETFGNVQAGGSLFKAGRRIILKNGFRGKNGFIAQIDTMINNCPESTCNNISGNRIGGGSQKDKNYTINYINESKLYTSYLKQTKFKTTKIIPNPTSSSITIQTLDNSPVQSILIKDLTGKILLQQSFSASSNSVTLDVSALSDGLYLCEIHTNVSVATEKIIVQR